MTENLNTLYSLIKRNHAEMLELDRLFCDHPAHDKVMRCHALMERGLVQDYWEGGGKRDVVKFLRFGSKYCE